MQAADVPPSAVGPPALEDTLVDSQCTTEAADSQVIWVAVLMCRACSKSEGVQIYVETLDQTFFLVSQTLS